MNLLPKILKGISFKSVFYLQASDNYTILYTTYGKVLLSAYNLKVFEELLEEHSFIRVDRAYLVNKEFIKGISNGSIIHLTNDETLTIPRRRKAMLSRKHPILFQRIVV